MSANLNQNEPVQNAKDKNRLAGGILLTGIGLGLLIFQLVGLPELFPILLGVVFLVAGIVTRKAALIIPGGIIGGAGLGTLSTVYGWFYPTSSVEAGGVFLLLFSIGWFSITLFTFLFTNDHQIWPLIPGGVMVLIGGAVLMGERGLRILEIVGTFWPLILVIIGLSILWGWWKERK